MSKSPTHFYEFGPFHLDPAERLLLRGEQPVQLTPKAFDTLVALVERSGHLVEKEELMGRVWEGSYVEENNLDKSISALRKALGSEGAKYIATVRGRGYRFAGSVREVSDSDEDLIVAEQTRTRIVIGETEENESVAEARMVGSARPANATTIAVAEPRVESRVRRGVGLKVAASFAVLSLLFGGAFWYRQRRFADAVLPPMKIVPLATSPETEVDSALSPDGKLIAFARQGPHDITAHHIYVKQVDAGEPLRISQHPERVPDQVRSGSPAWSPDGRYVAFQSWSPFESDCGIYIVPALGSAERKVYSFRSSQLATTGLDWSPDGKSILFSARSSPDEPFALTLLSLDSLETRRLTDPPAGWFGDSRAVFSPDARAVAFARKERDTSELYVVTAAGGQPQRLTFDDRRIVGVAWSQDGESLVFDSNRAGDASLWRVPAGGGAPEPLGIENALDPSIARQGNRLSYTQYLRDTNIWRFEIPRAPGDAVHAPVNLFPSTRRDGSPSLSPDGSRVAFISDRSGSYEVWTGESDGNGPAQLTSFGGPVTANPRWSPDGERIAFESHGPGSTDIYVISAQGGAARSLVSGNFDNVIPNWSRDGHWLYFASNRGGTWQVWKVSTDGTGAPAQVTTAGGFEAQESLDGQTLFYTKHETPGIFRAPVGGDEETVVLNLRQFIYESWGDWTLAGDGLYFVDRRDAAGASVKFLSLSNGTVSRILPLDKEPDDDAGLSVSPDGRWLLLTREDYSNLDIMLVENFR
jgi:Tol biopolymer transport system component/DNA-binding winged helix-turn-helix (wHTH) protein